MEISERTPEGIGGWLIIPFLGLLLEVPFMVYDLLQDFLTIFYDHASTVFLTFPSLQILLIGEIIANGIAFVFTLLLIWKFIKKSKRTPILYILLLFFILISQIVDIMATDAIISTAQKTPLFMEIKNDVENSASLARKALSRLVVTTFIWTIYFLVSRRVKNTFVH